MTPHDDLRTFLISQVTSVTTSNCFVGPVRPVSAQIPHNSVFCLSTGGRASDRVHSDLSELRYPTVQIRVRHNTFSSGYTFVKEIYDALFNANINGYWDIRLLQSEPVFILQDENSNYHWSINVEMRYQTN